MYGLVVLPLSLSLSSPHSFFSCFSSQSSFFSRRNPEFSFTLVIRQTEKISPPEKKERKKREEKKGQEKARNIPPPLLSLSLSLSLSLKEE
jgi:hypothetical protein